MPGKLSVICKPSRDAPIPKSNGRFIYNSVLSLIQETDPGLSEEIHDDPVRNLNVSGLDGPRRDSSKNGCDDIYGDAEYTFDVGSSYAGRREFLDAAIKPYAFGDEVMSIQGLGFECLGFDMDMKSYGEIEREAREVAGDMERIVVDFEEPTCISRHGDVYERFPCRDLVFSSLLTKWRQYAPEEMHFDLDIEEVREDVYEGCMEGYRGVNAVVLRKGDFVRANGWCGRCPYGFRDASVELREKLAKLALLGEYSGVGGFVSRGCGTVSVEIE